MPDKELGGLDNFGSIAAGDTAYVVRGGNSGSATLGDDIVTLRTDIAAAETDIATLQTDSVVVQRKSATLTGSDVATSSIDWSNTGLSVSITPKYADSTLVCTAYISDARASLLSGTHSERTGQFRIQNATDNSVGPRTTFGRVLIGTSTASAVDATGVVVFAEFTMDSTVARTINLQFHATVDATHETRIRIDADRWPTLVVEEIKAA